MKMQRIAGGGLRITALEIRNLWGVKEAVIRPGQRNIIRGANATGKSSLLNAIQLALGGGTLGKYQRIGTDAENEPAEIVLEISGPTDFIRVEREGDKPAKVLRRIGNSEAMERVPAPATFLKGLFDVRGSNPFAFLLASDDERAQLLLEALELEMDETALGELLGQDADLADTIPDSLHPLVRLSLIHDAVYSARRGCNVEAEGKRKAAEHLKRSVPAERIEDPSGQIEALDAQIAAQAEQAARREESSEAAALAAIDDAKQVRDREGDRLESELAAESKRLRGEHEKWAAGLRSELDRKIAERERVVGHEVEAISAATAANVHAAFTAREMLINEAEGTRDHERAAVAKLKDGIRDDRERLAQLRERQQEVSRHENTRAQIAEFELAAVDHEADSGRLSDLLRGLEELKRKLAEKLPVSGLDISGKEIRVNGVPWAQLNNAQQGAIAGVVAVERAKRSRLPVVFFDEAERFDGAHLDAISEIVEANGAQLFAAVVVRDGEIEVEADGQPVGTIDIDAPDDPVMSSKG